MNEDLGYEHQQALLEQEQMISLALDNCFFAGAPLDDLRFLAWQAGVSKWSPPQKVIQLQQHRR